MGEHTRDRERRERREKWHREQKAARERVKMGTILFATKGDGTDDCALRLPNGGYVGLKAATRMFREAALKQKR
jgi:hypothetical protein